MSFTEYDLVVAKNGNKSWTSIFWSFLFTAHAEQQFIVPPYPLNDVNHKRLLSDVLEKRERWV
jgi:hypothetical protein